MIKYDSDILVYFPSFQCCRVPRGAPVPSAGARARVRPRGVRKGARGGPTAPHLQGALATASARGGEEP